MRLIESMLKSASRSRSRSSISAGYPVRALTISTTIRNTSSASRRGAFSATRGGTIACWCVCRASAGAFGGSWTTTCPFVATRGSCPRNPRTTSRWLAISSRLVRKNSRTVASSVSPLGSATAAGAGAASGAILRWRTGRSPPGRYAPSAVRTVCPSTIQPGRCGTLRAETMRARRSSKSEAALTGTPATASVASAFRNRRKPGSPTTSHGIATCGRPSRILSTNWLSTRPGPASTKTRAPAAYMLSICSTKQTGCAT